VIAARPVQPPEGYSAPKVAPLYVDSTRVLVVWGAGMVRPGGEPDSVVVAEVDLLTDSVSVVATVEDVAWARIGGFVGPRDSYGTRAVIGIGGDGSVAVSNGLEYCFRRIALPRNYVKVCREWDRPLASNNRTPGDALIASLGKLGEMLRRLEQEQEQSRLKNSLEEILVDSSGTTWIRVVDATYLYHPFFLKQLPELRPSFYPWEVFDREGYLRHRVLLPSNFQPKSFYEGKLLGFSIDSDGVENIGMADTPIIGVGPPH